MSTPTFDGNDLTTRGEKQIAHPPRTRTFMGTVPGVEGVYTQENPVGSRLITVRGLMAASGSTPGNALSTLQAVVELIQDLQGLVKAYVGTDGTTYTDTLLQEYRAGEMEVAETNGGTPYVATTQVQAILVHTVPSVTA